MRNGSILDARTLSAVLMHGSSDARFRLAEGLASDDAVVSTLTTTVRSDESWLLRARCLEVLGLVAALAGEPRAKQILQALTAEGTPTTEGARR